MKKSILIALSLSASLSWAATDVTCTVLSLTDEGPQVLGRGSLSCEGSGQKLLTTAQGPVELSCAPKAGEIAVSLRDATTGTVLSQGRTLRASGPDSFSSYFATVEQTLVIHCENK